jgi:hypothetical protein
VVERELQFPNGVHNHIRSRTVWDWLRCRAASSTITHGHTVSAAAWACRSAVSSINKYATNSQGY